MPPTLTSTSAPLSTPEIVVSRLRTSLERSDTLSAEQLTELHELATHQLSLLIPFVPPPLVRAQLHNPQPGFVGGSYWEGSVLFADLSGFTTLSERLAGLGREGAEEVRRLISDLFAALLAELHAAGGAVLKFGGDAITAFFDADTLGSSHAPLAASAALAMQQRMQDFADLDTRAGRATLRLRIGVHSGRIFAAQVGDREHIELVVTGHQINRVAQAQAIAEPGQVIVSDTTLALLDSYQIAPSQQGFVLLKALPPPLRPPTPRLAPPPAARSLTNLRLAAEQIDALRPYLAHQLPERFISASVAESVLGEFRPVSVLFANFFDFSSLLESLGERTDLAAQALNCYYRRAQAIVHTYGGIINKVDMFTFGDKLMALFGAPVAHEDDTARAVYAALDLRHALAEANEEIASLLSGWPPSSTEQVSSHTSPQSSIWNPQYLTLNQRIGITAGTVFAGLVGGPERHEYTVMGSGVNLAAHLMGVSKAGQIMLSPMVCRAVSHAFDLQEHDPVRLKGVAEPVRPSLVLGIPDTQHETRRMLAIREAPQIGRDSELMLCHAAAIAALAGAGGVLTISGDAGIGKSRLAAGLLQRLAEEDSGFSKPRTQRVLVECQSFQQHMPYAPIRVLLRRMLHISNAAPSNAAQVLRKQVHLLVPQRERFAPLIAALLGLPAEETPLIAALTPEQRRDRLHELIVALLCALARRMPMLILIEDLQWADESSQMLLTQLAEACRRVPLLLALTYRLSPYLEHAWEALPYTTAIHLSELSDEESIQLATALLGGQLPDGVGQLIERAQGNPFFIEELLHTLVEQQFLLPNETGGWWLNDPRAIEALPNTIEGVITARLDLLNEQYRTVIQVAAVIGRRFIYPVLRDVLHHHDNTLRPALDELGESNLIVGDDDQQWLAYLFRQALTRDVAYESILFARRRELNGRVARVIERLFANNLNDQLALLARYYLLAEEWLPALFYHLEAGKQAQEQFANHSAIALYEQALTILPRLAGHLPSGMPADPLGHYRLPASAIAQATEIYERLGTVLGIIGEYDAALVRYQEALDLLDAGSDATPERIAGVYRQMGTIYERKGEFEQGFAVLEQARTLLGATPSTELARIYLLGAALYHRQGLYPDSIQWAEHAYTIAEQIRSEHDQAYALMLIGGNRHGLGENEQAIEQTRRSLAIYQQINDIAGVAKASNNLAGILHDIGEWEEARNAYLAAAKLEQNMGDTYGQAKIANNLGEVLRGLGDIDGAIEQYQIARELWRSSQFGTAVITMNLAATYLLRGDLEQAEALLKQSRTLFDQIGSDDFLPELLRYQAELLLMRGAASQALEVVTDAVMIARLLAASLEEGAACRVQAQVLHTLGRPYEARRAIEHTIALLREVGGRHELARALLLHAVLLAEVSEHALGADAFAEAVSLLHALGAAQELAYATQIAGNYGYVIDKP